MQLIRAMIPSNHAKTVENCRQDFLEDSMSSSIIESMELYLLDWSKPLDDGLLKASVDNLLCSFIDSITTIFSSDEVIASIHQCTTQWTQMQIFNEDYKRIAIPNLPLQTKDKDIRSEATNSYWSSFRYLSQLHLQQSVAKGLSDRQILFPASVARYIRAQGPSHSRYVSHPS